MNGVEKYLFFHSQMKTIEIPNTRFVIEIDTTNLHTYEK